MSFRMVKRCCGILGREEEGVLCGAKGKIEKRMVNTPVISIFEDRLKRKKISAKKTAIHFSERNILSYSQLNTFASCIARGLIERLGYGFPVNNPDKDLVIALHLGMSEKAIAAILGIMKTGAAFLPLDPAYPEDLLFQILDEFKPIMMITDDNGKIFNKYDTNKFAAYTNLVSIEELWLDSEFVQDTRGRQHASMDSAWIIDFLEHPSKGEEDHMRPVVIYHSHGLHSNPVGVRLTNKSIVNLIIYHWNKLGVKRKDVCCLSVSLASHDSLAQIFIPLLLGCTIHVFRKMDVDDTDNFVKNVSWRNVTRLSIPTYCLHKILDSIDFLGKEAMLKSLKSLKVIICRGAFIKHETAKWFFSIFKNGVTLGNCVGSVQTTCEVAFEMYESLKDYEAKLTTGRPTLGTVLDNVKIYLMDDNLKLVPDGSQGEICISGDCLAMGYVGGKLDGGDGIFESGQFVKNPVEDGPVYGRLHRTGEYGRILKHHAGKRRLYQMPNLNGKLLMNFYETDEGRHDTLIKVRGHYFSTEDVKYFLKELDDVTDAYVFVYHAGTALQEMIGFLMLTSSGEDNSLPAEYEFRLKSELPEFAIPDELKIVHRVPEHGFDKKKSLCPSCLFEIYKEEREPSPMEWDVAQLPPPPADDNEATVTLIKAIFKFCQIPLTEIVPNLNMSFYELGGRSINTMEVLLYLNQKGFEIDMKDFIEAGDLHTVIRLMRSKKVAGKLPSRISLMKDKMPLAIARPHFHDTINSDHVYSLVDITHKHKDPVIKILTSSYADKNEFQDYSLVRTEEFHKFFSAIWPLICENNNNNKSKSIVAVMKDIHGKELVEGALLSYDFFTDLSGIKAGSVLHEFIEEMKRVCIPYVPHYLNETLDIGWLGSCTGNHTSENVRIVTVLLQKIIVIAKEGGYSGLFLVTSNQLLRHLCINVFGFILLDDHPANRFVDVKGTRPYHLANDTVVAAACYLILRPVKKDIDKSLKVDPEKIFVTCKGKHSTLTLSRDAAEIRKELGRKRSS